MRYNPATDRALYTIDEIAEQCRNAILKADARRAAESSLQDAYAEILENARWEDDILIAA